MLTGWTYFLPFFALRTVFLATFLAVFFFAGICSLLGTSIPNPMDTPE